MRPITWRKIMKIRDSFFAIGLLLGGTGVLPSAQAELVRPQLSTEEQKLLNEELLQVVLDGWIYLDWKGDEVVARVQDLIARGANATFEDKNSWISLHYAASRGYLELIEVLIKASPGSVNYKIKDGSTPLHMAIYRRQNESIIEALVDAGADPDILNNEGDTPRQLAKERGFEDWLRGRRDTKPARAIPLLDIP